MNVTVFGNQKGGTGKTTTTLGIADALAVAGERVLVIDLDPQANATENVGLVAGDQPGIDELLGSPEAGVAAAAITTEWGFDLIPAAPDLTWREQRGGVGDEFLLREILNADDLPYDRVLIDTRPALGPLTLTALVAATSVVLVTGATYEGLKGVGQFQDNLDRIGRYNPDASLTGVIVNLYEGSIEQKHHAAELVDIFGERIWMPMIPKTVAAPATASAGVPPSRLKRRGATRLTVAYQELAARLVKETTP